MYGMLSSYDPVTSIFGRHINFCRSYGKNIQFTNHILSRPKFVNSSDRDRSVSPGKSTMGDRNNEDRMSTGVKPPPFGKCLGFGFMATKSFEGNIRKHEELFFSE